jgi:putative ABC transport system permease protein
MIILKLAWRNVWRNKNRSFITIGGIALGLAALVFIRAFIDGADSQMVENYTDLVCGHLQIHAKGFQKKMSLDLSISDTTEAEATMKNAPRLSAYASRIKDYALISSAEASSGILLIGIDAEKELAVTKTHKRIRAGQFLSGKQNDEIVIGKTLAEVLNVDLGKKVVVMSQGADGSMVAAAYRVCGIISSGAEEVDRGIALINLKAAQDLLSMEGKISEFAVRAHSIDEIDQLAKDLKAKFGAVQFEVLTWKEISPAANQFVEFDRAFSNILLFVVLIVVAASILNTMLMSVLERTKEFGVMLSLGTKRRQITAMVALESFFLGTIGVIFGTGIGLAFARYFGRVGIDLSRFAQAMEAYYTGSIIYPRILVNYVVLWVVIVLFTSVITSIYPAFKAANLKPVEALR